MYNPWQEEEEDLWCGWVGGREGGNELTQFLAWAEMGNYRKPSGRLEGGRCIEKENGRPGALVGEGNMAHNVGGAWYSNRKGNPGKRKMHAALA